MEATVPKKKQPFRTMLLMPNVTRSLVMLNSKTAPALFVLKKNKGKSI